MSKPEANPYKNIEQRQVQSALSSQRSKTYGGYNRLSGLRRARPSEASMPDTASVLLNGGPAERSAVRSGLRRVYEGESSTQSGPCPPLLEREQSNFSSAVSKNATPTAPLFVKHCFLS